MLAFCPPPNNTKSHTADLSSGFTSLNDILLPTRKLIIIAHNNPNKYTIPLRSLLNIEESVKKQTRMNGAIRKNKNRKVPKFKSISFKLLLYIIT
jgi:hypothetical protein